MYRPIMSSRRRNFNQTFTVVGDEVHIALHFGDVVIIDAADCDLLRQHRWRLVWNRANKYACCNAFQDLDEPCRPKTVLMHRLIMGAEHGQFIDHMDGNGLNNKRSNLRFCTRAQNCANRKVESTKTQSVYKGVSTVVSGKCRFMARVQCHGKMHILGTYLNEEEAARAYDRKAIDLFGEFAKTNFPRSNYETVA